MSVNQNPTRRQHYVQRAFLANFSSRAIEDKGGIWVYDKRGNSPRLQSLSNTALEKDIYTVRHASVKKPDILEHEVFTRIEKEALPALKSLTQIGKPELTPEIIGRLSGYLVTAHLRVPRNIDASRQLMEGVLLESLKATARNPKKVHEAWEHMKTVSTGTPLSEVQIKELLENPEKHVAVKAKPIAALLLNLQMLAELTRILISKNWTVCDAPDGAFFVTGDSPLIVFARMGSSNVIFGGGFALPQVQIHFPVSPARCLFISGGNWPAYLKLSKPAVNEVNRRCIAMAERFVFAPYRSNRIQKLIEDFATYSSGPKVDRDRLAQKLATDAEDVLESGN